MPVWYLYPMRPNRKVRVVSLWVHRPLHSSHTHATVPSMITNVAHKIITSPVDMEARRALDIRTGDTVRVHQKIQEGKDKQGNPKFRIQLFEGLVLARKHGREAGGTFTVRRVSGGIGVEKIYPLYTPMIEKIEIVKRARVRRAKLYYIREKVTREVRRQLRRTRLMSTAPTEKIEVGDAGEATESTVE